MARISQSARTTRGGGFVPLPTPLVQQRKRRKRMVMPSMPRKASAAHSSRRRVQERKEEGHPKEVLKKDKRKDETPSA